MNGHIIRVWPQSAVRPAPTAIRYTSQITEWATCGLQAAAHGAHSAVPSCHVNKITSSGHSYRTCNLQVLRLNLSFTYIYIDWIVFIVFISIPEYFCAEDIWMGFRGYHWIEVIILCTLMDCSRAYTFLNLIMCIHLWYNIIAGSDWLIEVDGHWM